MPLTLKPATGSGQMTLISVAGTTTSDTLTLPAKTGNIITSADTGTVTQAMLGTNVAGNGPAFLVYKSTAQSISGATFTKIQFDAEETNGDTNNNFDITTNYRFTPTVAGYYQINASWQVSSAISAAGQTGIMIYKNGAVYKWGDYAGVTTNAAFAANVSSLVYCNGSTDYIEIYAYIGGANTVLTGIPYTWANGFLARAA